MSKTILICLSVYLIAVLYANRPGITEFKPAISGEKSEMRDFFVGKWESRHPTKSGGTRLSTLERHADSRYVINFKLLDASDEIKQEQTEFGYWGVSGGVYFTMFRGWIENDELKDADPNNAYHYDSYKILELSDDKLVYQSLSSGNQFTYTRVEPSKG